MKIVCAECNTAKIVSNKSLIPYKGKIISTKCANRECSHRIKFKVPQDLTKEITIREKKRKVKEKVVQRDPKTGSAQNKRAAVPKKKKTYTREEAAYKNDPVPRKDQKTRSGTGKTASAPIKKEPYIKKETVLENDPVYKKPKSGLVLIILMFLSVIVNIFIFLEELKELLPVSVICSLLIIITGSVILLAENKQNRIRTPRYAKATRVIAVILLSAPFLIITFLALIIAYQNYFNV
jgi:hypothetical protein